MWIYYHCMHGPGHQSTTSGFKSFHDDRDEEYISENLERTALKDCRNATLRFWSVAQLPAEYVKEEKKNVRLSIVYYKNRLKVLEAKSYFRSNDKEEADKVIQRNMRGKITSDLLRKLHRAGFIYEARDVHHWRVGKKSPIEPTRTKILAIIRRSQSYPGY